MKKAPFFSIIIPVSKNADRIRLKNCLRAISYQNYIQFETILVEETDTGHSKSQARNYGATKARGKYLVHIDVDYVLAPSVLRKCLEYINRLKARTIILQESVVASKNIWQQARALEKDVLSQNKFLSTPQVIQKKLFEEIGGFDEEIDALDDWVLNIKLDRVGVKPYKIITPKTFVYESTNIVEIIKRRFNKGRYLKPFIKKYGKVAQTAIFPTLKLYREQLTNSSPISTFVALIILKFFDTSAFYLGSIFPSKPSPSYQSKKVAEGFDREQNSFYARLKHKIEAKYLLSLLPPHTNHPPASYTRKRFGRGHSPHTILELGCGTGRITQVLVDTGYKITPTDISPAMLKIYKSKLLSETGSSPSRRPKPVLLKPGRLPYKDNSYDYVIAMRVIWHIIDKSGRELFLNEALRVAKKGVVMDFAIKNYGLNRFYTNDYFFTKEEIEKWSKKHGKIIASKKLPLGRLLVKISKV